MKKSWMILSAIMISGVVIAQNDPGTFHKERHDGGGETMKTVLQLNDAQASNIEEINKKYREETKAKFEENRKEMKDLQSKRQAEVDKVLTPEQKVKWQSYKQGRTDERKAQFERRKKHHEGRRHHRSHGR